MNLVQNQAKKPWLDKESERIVDLYRSHEISVKRPPAADLDAKFREQDMLLKKFELQMRFHERGRENWPQEVRDTYDRLNAIDFCNTPSVVMAQKPVVKPPCRTTAIWRSEVEAFKAIKSKYFHRPPVPAVVRDELAGKSGRWKCESLYTGGALPGNVDQPG
ncbi:unnamed protein product [Trichogramma brassicae]|uniref:Uncharacterized protein n=1 Tax=Trichogramma brassicae TaxID=86971 RepID=A0A6H5IVH0_9HYME|nr:unnamed protein product [Trichogramma brassicae]